LLMASVRAALRTRAAKPGTPAEILSEVNRLVGRDTGETGHFVTLFYLEIDAAKKTLRWVRAGHEPAWLIDPQSGGATQLKGEGMAVGVDLDSDYPENTRELLHSGQVLFIGTDGVADSRNPTGERFGTERVISLLLQWSSLSSDEIVGRILDALSEFRGAAKQEDDVTLVVIKAVA